MTIVERLPLQRLAAFAILLALIAIIWTIGVLPLLSAWEDRIDQVDRASELLAHLNQSAADASSVRQELSTMVPAQHDPGLVLVAGDANLAGASLQSEVKRIAEANGGQVRSIQLLSSVPEDAITRIGVHLALQADTVKLARILYDIETHKPLLLVGNLGIHGQEQQIAPSAQPPPALTIDMDISAFYGAPNE